MNAHVIGAGAKTRHFVSGDIGPRTADFAVLHAGIHACNFAIIGCGIACDSRPNTRENRTGRSGERYRIAVIILDEIIHRSWNNSRLSEVFNLTLFCTVGGHIITFCYRLEFFVDVVVGHVALGNFFAAIGFFGAEIARHSRFGGRRGISGFLAKGEGVVGVRRQISKGRRASPFISIFPFRIYPNLDPVFDVGICGFQRDGCGCSAFEARDGRRSRLFFIIILIDDSKVLRDSAGIVAGSGNCRLGGSYFTISCKADCVIRSLNQTVTVV